MVTAARLLQARPLSLDEVLKIQELDKRLEEARDKVEQMLRRARSLPSKAVSMFLFGSFFAAITQIAELALPICK